MNYSQLFTDTFRGKRISQQATIAIISGVAIGAAVATLFATEKGKKWKGRMFTLTRNLFNKLTGNTADRAKDELGTLISDVRTHVKKNADGLLGPSKRRQNPTEIHVDHIGTTAWKDKPTRQTVNHQPQLNLSNR